MAEFGKCGRVTAIFLRNLPRRVVDAPKWSFLQATLRRILASTRGRYARPRELAEQQNTPRRKGMEVGVSTMRLLAAAVFVLFSLAEAATAVSQSQWCPNYVSMSVLISAGYELKAVYKYAYARPVTTMEIMNDPKGVQSETVFFLQKGSSMVKCSEEMKWDHSTSVSCEHLVATFDPAQDGACK
jgi:hypothetical protein